MTQQFKALSLSHTKAPLTMREMFALDIPQCQSFALKLKELFSISELFIVSTCNRTEIYYLADANYNEEIIKALCVEKGIFDTSLYLPFFEHHIAINGIQRLFEVAAGLQSKVIGDLQISNQIKLAYQAMADVDMAGPFIHRLLHSIFFTNKRIAQETGFRDGAASVTYIAVTMAEELCLAKPKAKILVLGLGEIGIDVCKYLSEKSFAEVTVINRTLAKSEKIAQEFGYKALPFDQLLMAVGQADVIISSARTEQPLINKALLEQIEIFGVKTFIDLAVPRSVATDVEQLPGILAYNIDTLQHKADQALAQRMKAIPAVNQIIGESIEQFNDWSKEAMVSPVIQKFKNALEQIRKEELNRYFKDLSETEAEKVDKITQSIIQKIIKMPVIQLKAACKRNEAEAMVEAINELFNLEAYNTPVQE